MSDDGRIDIRYWAEPRTGGGFTPKISVNGRASGWGCYSQAEALALAERDANEERLRYVGDWTVTIAVGP